jgi:hypothetical protein
MRAAAALLLSLTTLPAIASTTANNDSCDIAQQPAATLLLPYFEVDFRDAPSIGSSTIFSVQNTSPQPQIANVTIWTDWAYPVVNFPIFLTGYDVQAISLYDVIARGILAPPRGTSSTTPVPTNPTAGSQPLANTANPNFLPDAAVSCGDGKLAGAIPAPLLTYIQHLLADQPLTSECGSMRVGGLHYNAVGYITIDVVATCAPKTPASSDYYSSLILFDNVLTGDYQIVRPTAGHQYVLGSPMVHIRAIPGGGAVGSIPATPLPYTCYDRLTQAAATRTADRRQPLSAACPRPVQSAFPLRFRIGMYWIPFRRSGIGRYRRLDVSQPEPWRLLRVQQPHSRQPELGGQLAVRGYDIRCRASRNRAPQRLLAAGATRCSHPAVRKDP